MHDRFACADQFRGVTALIVVLIHVTFVAQTARSGVALVVASSNPPK